MPTFDRQRVQLRAGTPKALVHARTEIAQIVGVAFHSSTANAPVAISEADASLNPVNTQQLHPGECVVFRAEPRHPITIESGVDTAVEIQVSHLNDPRVG